MKQGLIKSPAEKRKKEFKFGAFFAVPKLTDIPDEFIVAQPIRIKNQGDSMKCLAYASSSVNEDAEGVELDPEKQAEFISKTIGHDINEEGADLLSGCKTLTTIGSLEVTDDGKKDDINLAYKHAKQAYFEVEGKYDTFDSIRSVLWANRGLKRTILTGANWRTSWQYAPQGIIPETYEEQGSGHAIKILGWKIINGTEYVIIQNSYGEEVGDKGLYYMSRAVANRELTFGAYTFADLPENMTKEEMIKKSQMYQLNLMQKWLLLLSEWVKLLFKPTQNEVKPPQDLPVVEPSVPAIDSIPFKPEIATYLWDTKENIRHSIRVICDEQGLNVFQKDLICRICECESGYNPKAKLVNSPKSIDRGLFQINNYWHPTITDELAYNPIWATKWAIQALKDGKVKTYWLASSSCWNRDGKYAVYLK